MHTLADHLKGVHKDGRHGGKHAQQCAGVLERTKQTGACVRRLCLQCRVGMHHRLGISKERR